MMPPSRGSRTILRAIALALGLALPVALPSAGEEPYHDPDCLGTRARTWLPATGVADGGGDVRVYAIQYKQEIAHVRDHDSFRHKMRCLVEELVMPTADPDGDGRADRATIVALNEDAGLATLAIGSRGAAARAIGEHGPKDPQNIPGALGAFATLGVTYSPAIAHYAAREPDTSPQRLILAAATDTFARGFMAVNSEIARDYGVYVVSSNNQAEFRITRDPVAVTALRDPDLTGSYLTGDLDSVYEAVDNDAISESVGAGRAGIDVSNFAFMWAPVEGVTDYAQARFGAFNGAPITPDDPRANIIHATHKTPLTQIERDILDLSDDRDMSTANTGPFRLLPPDDQRIAIGYGISLPAFKWGTSALGGEVLDTPLNDGVDPCAQPETWMRCLDHRGVGLFLQPEANPGMWAEYHDLGWDPGAFQALSWLDSAWRAVADSTVENIRYAVTPHMVGNLIDLTFDGQSVIFERCGRDEPDRCAGNLARTFVGATGFVECAPGEIRCDDPSLAPYTGPKRETIVMAPWVLPDDPSLDEASNREQLAARSRAMQAGTGSPHENDYLETAVWADLDFD